MGTNYDAVWCLAAGDTWPNCAQHIGKSSAGCAFMFESLELGSVMDGADFQVSLRSTPEWRGFLDEIDAKGWIQDEYGHRIAVDDFWELVESKRVHGQHGGDYTDEGNDFSLRSFS